MADCGYPVPACDRITPVPERDAGWVNVLSNVVVAPLAITESPPKTASKEKWPHHAYSLIAAPLEFRDPQDFPDDSVFNAVRAKLAKNGFHIKGRIDGLDELIEGNYKGYARFETGPDFYRDFTLLGNARAFFPSSL